MPTYNENNRGAIVHHTINCEKKQLDRSLLSDRRATRSYLWTTFCVAALGHDIFRSDKPDSADFPPQHHENTRDYCTYLFNISY